MSGGFDPEEDLLRRYEQMVQTQVGTLNGIDDKAAYVAKLVGIVLGLLVSIVSLVVGTETIEISLDTGFTLLMVALAISAFFISMAYAIITYLSSKFQYGPTSDLGEVMADYHVHEQDYRDMMLRGYSGAIKANRRVVINNSKRFERCLTSLLLGILFFFSAGVLLVLPGGLYIDAFLSLVILGIAFYLARYILKEEYLTLERKHPIDK